MRVACSLTMIALGVLLPSLVGKCRVVFLLVRAGMRVTLGFAR